MLTIFRRHTQNCPHNSKGRSWKSCKCPIHCEGVLGKEYIRESLDTRSWDVAQTKVRNRETANFFPVEEKPEPITVKDAVEKFFADCSARKLSSATISKFDVLLKKQLKPFCEARGLRLLEQLTVEVLRDFRQTWSDGPLSAYKKNERLRSFFRWCCDAKYIGENPAGKLKPPKQHKTAVKTFSAEEWWKVVNACDRYDPRGIYGVTNRARLKAFIFVLRYSGL